VPKTLGQRTHRCPDCGLIGDRDLVSAALAAFTTLDDAGLPGSARVDYDHARRALSAFGQRLKAAVAESTVLRPPRDATAARQTRVAEPRRAPARRNAGPCLVPTPVGSLVSPPGSHERSRPISDTTSGMVLRLGRMDQDAITQYVATTFAGVDAMVGSEEAGSPEVAWGDTFFIYDPHRTLEGAKRFPFATIVTKDYGEFDNASNLDRPGVFRLNIGLSKETYTSLFDDNAEHDFTTLDELMPHPVYGGNHWVCVLNPSEATFATLRPLLQEAYDRAVERYSRSNQAVGDTSSTS
jgi:hypothetical protein